VGGIERAVSESRRRARGTRRRVTDLVGAGFSVQDLGPDLNGLYSEGHGGSFMVLLNCWSPHVGFDVDVMDKSERIGWQ
jgi:hypothetical protein